MNLTIKQIAEAFSGHTFETTYPYLLDDVRWNLIGDKQITGKEGVISTCKQTLTYLENATTKFSKFETLEGENFVVIDSLAEYKAEDSTSIVASCDIYKFRDGKVAEITSYTTEIK